MPDPQQTKLSEASSLSVKVPAQVLVSFGGQVSRHLGTHPWSLQSPFDTLIDAAFWVTYYLNAQKESKKE